MINEQQLQILTDRQYQGQRVFKLWNGDNEQFRGEKLYRMVAHFVFRGLFQLTDSVCWILHNKSSMYYS